MPTIRIVTDEAGQTPKALGLNLAWSEASQRHITEVLSHYPKDRSRSALIPLLWLAQRQFGWLSVDAMQLVADTLQLPYIRVYEVASFYTMFNLKPVGKYHIQVCTNCSCLIRGSDSVMQAVQDITGLKKDGDTTEDGMFTLTEVECLGACVAAPMMQVGTHYYTHLTPEKTREIMKHLTDGGDPAKYADTVSSKMDPIHHGAYGA
jgi:NADH-quinone oxidoreductase E subunit